MNKIYLCFLFIFLMGTCYADTMQSESNIAVGQKSHNTLNKDFTKESSTSNKEIYVGTKNPYIGYCAIDFLWWKAKRTGHAYHFDTTDQTEDVLEGNVLPNKSKFSGGFRVELGFSNVYDWVISSDFTFYQNTVLDHIDKKYSPIPAPGYAIQKLDEEFTLTYWTADLLMSSNFHLSKTVAISPFIAVRGAQMRYHLSTDSLDQRENTLIVNIYRTPYNFVGFGPYVGMKGFYEHKNSGITFFGKLATSLLYGKIKTREYRSFYTVEIEPAFTKIDIHSRFNDLKAHLELQLGGFWKKYFECDQWAFIMGLNWETNYWWNIKNYPPTVGILSAKSLILFGVNAFVGCEF